MHDLAPGRKSRGFAGIDRAPVFHRKDGARRPKDAFMYSTIALSVLNGAVWACILAMVSIGLTLIYGQLEIINIAHGAMYAVGAVTAYYVTSF